MQQTKELVMDQLTTVIDPELYVSIVDLGLVYDVKILKTKTVVTMTLTSLGCPLFPVIEQDIQNALFKIGVKKAQIKLTFDPPWSMDRMSERGKAILGI